MSPSNVRIGYGYGAITWPGAAPALGFRGDTSWYVSNRPSLGAPVRTFYVDASAGLDTNPGTSGAPFQTLGKINTVAQAGDLFYMKGSFSGYLRPNNSGTAGAFIAFKPWPGQNATIASNNVDYPSLWFDSRDYLWVEGLNIDQGSFNTSGGAGLMRGANHCVLMNCTMGSGASTDIRNSATFNWIEGCTYTGYVGSEAGNNGDIIWMSNGANDNVVYNCTFGRSGHTVVTLGVAASTDAHIYRNRIAFCTITNPWAGGINLNGYAHESVIEGNQIYEIGTSPTTVALSKVGVFTCGFDNIVRYNRIWNCAAEGITLEGYSGLSITQHCERNHVHNNTIYNCQAPAIAWKVGGQNANVVINHDGNITENNLGWNNNRGDTEQNGTYFGVKYLFWINLYNTVTTTWNTWSSPSRTFNTNIFRNNLFAVPETSNVAFCLYVAKGGTTPGNTMYTLSEMEAAFPTEASGNKNTDPSLTTTAGSDFLKIPNTSVAVDAGYATSGLAYQGAAVDIGAYEAA